MKKEFVSPKIKVTSLEALNILAGSYDQGVNIQQLTNASKDSQNSPYIGSWTTE